MLLTLDHKVILKKVKPGALAIHHRGKLYNVNTEAVAVAHYEGKPKKAEPRLFYYENDPSPISYMGEKKERPDRSFDLMEREIRLNAINQQSSPSLGSKLGPIAERVGSWFSLYNAFILIVVASLVWGYISGALVF